MANEEYEYRAEIPYTFSRISGYHLGSLAQPRIQISVDPSLSAPTDDEEDEPFNFDHKNLINTFFRDDNSNPRRMIYQHFDEPFQTWINEKMQKSVYPLMTYQIPKLTQLTLNPCVSCISYVPNVFKSKIRAMVKLIAFIHEKGYCIRAFDMRNLVIKDGVLKFWGLKFIRSTFLIHQQSNYAMLYRVLESVFNLQTLAMPDDLKHFKELLRSYNSTTQRDLLVNHISILSSVKRLQFLRDVFEKRLSLGGTQGVQYHGAINKMKGGAGWKQQAVLYAPIDHQLKNPSGPKSNKPSSNNPAAGPSSSNPTNTRKIYYQDCGKPYNVNLSLLRFLRNLVTHLRDYQDDFGTTFTDCQIDAMVVSAFGDPITSLQVQLNKERFLTFFFRDNAT